MTGRWVIEAHRNPGRRGWLLVARPVAVTLDRTVVVNQPFIDGATLRNVSEFADGEVVRWDCGGIAVRLARPGVEEGWLLSVGREGGRAWNPYFSRWTRRGRVARSGRLRVVGDARPVGGSNEPSPVVSASG